MVYNWWFWYLLIGIPAGTFIWHLADKYGDQSKDVNDEWDHLTSHWYSLAGIYLVCWGLWLPVLIFAVLINGSRLWRLWRNK